MAFFDQIMGFENRSKRAILSIFRGRAKKPEKARKWPKMAQNGRF